MNGGLKEAVPASDRLRAAATGIRSFLLDPSPGWNRTRDGAVLGLLAAITLATRLPLRARFLTSWDSVLFALALERYNVLEARPHPPGYPVYIALGRLLQALLGDPNATLVALSILFTVGAVLLLYVLARQVAGPRAAIAAAFLFAVAPVLVENSLIATSYPGEAFFSIAVALGAWRFHAAPSVRRALILGVLFALAVGYRQSLFLFLSPLIAWSFLTLGSSLAGLAKHSAAGALAAASVAALWLVPMVAASGGLAAYLETTGLQSRLVVFGNTVFSHGAVAWSDLWPRFLLYVHWELLIILPAIAVLTLLGWLAARRAAKGAPVAANAGGAAERARPSGPARVAPGRLALFIALWAVPAILFYLLVFNGWGEGPNGYILAVLPAVYLVYGLVADAAVRRIEARTRRAPGPAPVGRGRMRTVAAAALALLLLAPAVPLVAAWGDGITRIRDHDAWAESWLGLKAVHSGEDTAIVASYSWAHVKWYFPEYLLWGIMELPPGADGAPRYLTLETRGREDTHPFYLAHADPASIPPHPVPPGIKRLVLFDFQLVGENGGNRLLHDDIPVHEEWLPNGWRILTVDTDPARPMIEDHFRFDVHAHAG